MRTINNYIIEKLKINKDTKLSNDNKEKTLINNIIELFEDFIKRYIKDFDDYEFTINFQKNYGVSSKPVLFYTFHKEFPRFAKYYNDIEHDITKFYVNSHQIFDNIYFYSDEKTIELHLNDEIF